MKYLRIIILLVIVTSCGSSKRAIESSEKTDNTTTSVKTETPSKTEQEAKVIEEVEEVEEVKNMSITNTAKDTVIIATDDKPKVDKTIHSKLNQLLENYVTETGNVDYQAIKVQREDLDNYINSLTSNTPTDSWTKEEKLAYWINAYNALTIDLILRNYPLKSIKDIKDPWDQRLWKFGDKWQNLNDIEHQILRKMNEPRIHFAIVCASFSCPKLQNEAFTAQNLEEQLTRATKEFLADEARNNISEDEIKLSKIFKWFAKDFKVEGSIIDFLNKYTEVEISSKAKKTFKDYNWDLND